MKPSFLMAAERAIRELDVAFRESGFQASPPGLIRLLRGFVLKDNETPEEGRRRFFRRVFGILWYGNNIGKGQFRGKALPTYVYPECLKTAIRDKLSEGLRDYPNPQTSAVYTITMSDLHGAKWPGDKK